MRFWVFILALSAAGINAAQAKGEFYSGNWHGAAYDAANGQFTHCAISVEYVTDIGMIFSINRAYDLKLAFYSLNWRLNKGDQYDLVYWIDRHAPGSATATALSDRMVVIDLPDRTSTFERFQRGYILYVKAVGEAFQFSLRGTYRALTRLLQCVDNQLRTEQAAVTNPFVTQPSAALPPSDPDRRLEATTFVANLLNQAGLSSFTILAPKEVPAELSDYDVVWSGPSIFGALKIIAPGVVSDQQQIPPYLISGDSADCTGEFASGSRQETLDSGVRITQVLTACRHSEGDEITAIYTIFPLEDGSFYSIGHVVTGERTRAEEADDRIISAIPVLMKGRLK